VGIDNKRGGRERKMIKKLFITIIVIILLSGVIVGCEKEQPEITTPTYPEATMTADQVINIVLVYGVPEFPIKGTHSVGQWAAVYEGKGKWRIKGSLARTGTSLTWSTTWTYSNNKIILIDYHR
jgi:hypothetical protein